MDNAFKKHFNKAKKLTIFTIIFVIMLEFLCFFSKSMVKSVAKASSGSSAIVIEQSSGRVLFSENENAKLPIASTTKILTALVVLQKISDLDEKFIVPSKAIGIEGSSIYLKENEVVTYRTLLYGLMLRSGNDAAVALAVKVGGDIAGFAELMNQTAQKCGAKNSNFTNPHGLQDENHYSSAYDLAVITAEAFNNSTFLEIVSTKSIKFGEGENVKYFENKNKMLRLYEGANGVKTGFTKVAGRCLVSSAKKNGMQLISVVLNHGDMWNDSIGLLDYGFNHYKMRNIVENEPMLCKVNKGEFSVVLLKPRKTFSYPLTDEEYNNLDIIFNLPESLNAPIKSGSNVGKIQIYSNNRLLFETDLYTIQEVNKRYKWFK